MIFVHFISNIAVSVFWCYILAAKAKKAQWNLKKKKKKIASLNPPPLNFILFLIKY